MALTNLFRKFFESNKSGGFVLVLATAVSLFLANSTFSTAYRAFWLIEFWEHSLTHWINDGLMVIFFLLIGLELEREIYVGELSTVKKASLPLFGALGGMLLPAGIFLIFNFGTPSAAGAGIPMATDIAFAIGILSLLGNRVPVALKIFLTALAVIDDLGAILVIAFFYTNELSLIDLGISLGIFALLLVLNRLKIRNLILYLIGGIFMWYFMLHSGIHATITGILLAFAIPFGNGNEKSTSYILQDNLHKPVAFIILPLFALANTAIIIENDWQQSLMSVASIGIFLGLVLGKPIGIWVFCWCARKLHWASLPKGLKWTHIFGAGCLGGIGFTMSIFIALLAFDNPEMVDVAKISILFASLTAVIIGFTWLKIALKHS